MKDGKFKILSGIAWLSVFIVLLVTLDLFYNPKTLSVVFANPFARARAYVLSLINPKYKGPKTLVKQEVIEQESAVISVVDKVSPSVVSVVVKTVGFDFFSGESVSESGIGTGFIVDPNGLIVTNSHVVDDPSGEYSVVLKDGTSYDVTKVHLDEASDVAILEITARNLTVVELGDSNTLKVGQTAIAIGNALGRYQNTVTVGVVSGIARELRASSPLGRSKTYEDAIQTDAALNPGNSGGPLLNSAGQVIGVNVATTIGADNIGFAIPVNNLKPILEGFLKQGRIVKPYIGVSYTMITKDIATLRKLPEGAFISTIVPNSPAERAGLRRGDIIVKYNDLAINSDNTLSKAVSGSKVGDKVTLTVDRNDTSVMFTVVLEEASAPPQL